MAISEYDKGFQHCERHFNAATCGKHYTNTFYSMRTLGPNAFEIEVSEDREAGEKIVNVGDLFLKEGRKSGQVLTWYVYEAASTPLGSDRRTVKIIGVDLYDELAKSRPQP